MGSDAAATSPRGTSHSLLTPMRQRAFAVLWIGVASAFLAQYMIPLAAQWYLVSTPGGPPLVPLVQVAVSVPMALIAVPAGVLADNLDRRRMILAAQTVALVIEALLAALALTGRLSAPGLFICLALLAACIPPTYTAFSSMVPDIVERPSIPSASALLAIATNATRVAGPALAGFIIAASSVGMAFASAIPATVLLLLMMLRWGGQRTVNDDRERFMPAVWSGFRYVRHSPQALKIIARGLWFTAGVGGLMGLLPLLAANLGANSTQLGLMLAAQGAGAVLGAITLTRLRRRTTSNRMVGLGFVTAGIGTLLCALATNLPLLAAAVVLTGWAWTTALATIQAGMQLYLPAWVRARGMAMLLVANLGGQGVGALALGVVASVFDVRWALAVGATLLAAGAILTVTWPLKDLEHVDRSSVRGWHAPELHITPEQVGGEVWVRVHYTVPQESRTEFLEVMHRLRRIRLRSGAMRWKLLKDSVAVDVFIEDFMVGSWGEYQHQQRSRAVVSDRAVEAEAASLSVEGATVSYAFGVETMDPDRAHA
ncbi:MAG: MFS transporter [Actinomycetales bacterium]